MEISELKKLEMNIGFTTGILVGATASFIVIMFIDMKWYFKLFSAIGGLGIIGSLLLTLNELIKSRRNYLEIMKEMKNEKGGKEKWY